jgi:2-C-methyl-D-erythritol 4-phosphate cytidylyltransferase
MEVVAIVLGAGSGQRMGGRPKALLDLLGRPMFLYSVRSFVLSGQIAHIVLVVPSGAIQEVQIQLVKHELSDFVTVTGGGNSRSESAALGLKSAPNSDLVMIHDASRPCLTTDLVLKALESAKLQSPVVPGLPVVDTIRRFSQEGSGSEIIDRENLFNIQTPQVFRRDQLSKIYAETEGLEASDDAFLYESLGLNVFRFEGDPENLKVTFPGDIGLAEQILRSRGVEPL